MAAGYIKNDLKHFAVNLGQLATGFLWYIKFGFYGWAHLISAVIIQYTILPIDDWLDDDRPFPYYALLLVMIAFYFYPLITAMAMLGNVLANIQFLLKKESFWLARLESLGSIPIYILPFSIPAGINDWRLYTAATLFVLFADSFHKLGHQETKARKLMWLSGLIFLGLLAFIFATPTITFMISAIIIFISLIPFAKIKDKKTSWAYTQIWFAISSLTASYYFLFEVLP